jgi:hypothetical protein
MTKQQSILSWYLILRYRLTMFVPRIRLKNSTESSSAVKRPS